MEDVVRMRTNAGRYASRCAGLAPRPHQKPVDWALHTYAAVLVAMS
jgi:hypothetical protein